MELTIADLKPFLPGLEEEIGSASWRESGELSVGAGS